MSLRVALPCLLSCTACVAPGHQTERQVMTMGTQLWLGVEAKSAAKARTCAELAIRAVETADHQFSNWRNDSLASQLNRTRVGKSLPTTEAYQTALRRALHWRQVTGHAFDPGSGKLLELWGVRSGGAEKAPSAQMIAKARVDAAPFALADGGVSRLHDSAQLATGGFAKGHGLDQALRVARHAGATWCSLDFGGQLAWFGANNGHRATVACPTQRGLPAIWLRLPQRGSLATSGNSERPLRIGDQEYTHILDPRSGKPASDFGSVTVFATTEQAALDADCLSTALFVLGRHAGLRLAERLPNIEALFLERDGLRTQAHMTSGFEPLVHRWLDHVTLSTNTPPKQ